MLGFELNLFKNCFNWMRLPIGLLVISNAFGIENLTYFQTNSHRENENIFGHLGFTSNELTENVGDVTGNKYFIDADFNYQSKGARSKTVLEFAAISNNEQDTMYSVPKAYYQYMIYRNEFYFGRSIVKWSPIDETWGLGKLNNRINFDQFKPGQEGLTGVQYQLNRKSGFYMGAFASLLYIPEMNPQLKINKNDGTVTCNNPWCKAPTAQTQIRDQVVPIKYEVNMPPVDEVVLKYSVGLNLGHRTQMTELNIFGMRKPENKPSVSAELSFNQDPSLDKEDWVNVSIDPQIYYHDVLGATFALKGNGQFNGLKAHSSVLGIYPNVNPEGERIVYEYTGIKQEKRKEEYLASGLSYNWRRVQANANYIARVSSFDHESDDILVELPRWNQAINLGAEVQVTETFASVFDYKYDMITDDRLLMFSLRKQIGRDLLVSTGINMIGAPSDQSYWSDFRNNDAVFASLRLLF